MHIPARAEMMRRVRQQVEAAGREFSTDEIVEKVIADMTDGDRQEWAEDVLRLALGEMVGLIVQRDRQALSRIEKRAAELAGESEVFVPDAFDVAYSVDGTWKRVGEMTGEDHLHVAESFEGNARRQMLEAAFHRTVAKKLGKRTTADVFAQDEYAVLYRQAMTKGAKA